MNRLNFYSTRGLNYFNWYGVSYDCIISECSKNIFEIATSSHYGCKIPLEKWVGKEVMFSSFIGNQSDFASYCLTQKKVLEKITRAGETGEILIYRFKVLQKGKNEQI